MSFERPREHAVGETAADDEAAVCGYCGRPFVREDYLALHRGLEHGAVIDDAEREAFETAHEAEHETIRLFRLKAIFVLVVIYFGFLMVYALVI